MTNDAATRRRAAALLMKLTRRPEDRAGLAAVGHRSGQPIIVVLATDTLGHVFGRLFDEHPEAPALIAVFWDEVPAKLDFLTINPDATFATPEAQDAAHSSTIGMLIETMHANDMREVNVRLTSPAVMAAHLRSHDLLPA